MKPFFLVVQFLVPRYVLMSLVFAFAVSLWPDIECSTLLSVVSCLYMDQVFGRFLRTVQESSIQRVIPSAAVISFGQSTSVLVKQFCCFFFNISQFNTLCVSPLVIGVFQTIKPWKVTFLLFAIPSYDRSRTEKIHRYCSSCSSSLYSGK